MGEFQPFLIADTAAGIFRARQSWRAPAATWEDLENCSMRYQRVEVRKGYVNTGRIAPQQTESEPDPGAVAAHAYGISPAPIEPQTLRITAPTSVGVAEFADTRTNAQDPNLGELVCTNGVIAPSPVYGDASVGRVDYTTGIVVLDLTGTPGATFGSGNLEHVWQQPGTQTVVTGIHEYQGYDATTPTATLAFDQNQAYRFNEATLAWDPVTQSAAFAMAPTDRLTFAQFQGVLLFTWGDALWRYDPLQNPAVAPVTLQAVGASTVNITKVSTILVDRDRVLYMNVEDDVSGTAQNRPARAWRTTINTYDQFDTEAEFNDAPTPNAISAAGRAGPIIMVGFSGNVFFEYRYVGGRVPYRWVPRSEFRGCDSRRGLVATEREIMAASTVAFVASEGRDVYDADEAIPNQSRKIRPNAMQRGELHVVDEQDQVWLSFADDDEPSRSRILTSNYREPAWGQHVMDFTCLGDRTSQVSSGTQFVPWDDVGIFLTGDPQMPWNENTLIPNQNALVAGSPVLLAGDREGRIYQLNEGATDNGQVIVARARTQWLEFAPEMRSRFGWVDLVLGDLTVTGGTGRVKVRLYKDWESASFREEERTVTPDRDSKRLRFGVNQVASVFAIEVVLTGFPGQTLDAIECWAHAVGRSRAVA